MPRYKRRYRKKRTYTKKRGVSTVAKLTRSVQVLKDAGKAHVTLQWSRGMAPMHPTVTIASVGLPFTYMCPIPTAPSQIANSFAENIYEAAGAATPSFQQQFQKIPLWAHSVDAKNMANISHTGSTITYRLVNTLRSPQRSFKVALISPMKAAADQMGLQRQLQYFVNESVGPPAQPFLPAGHKARFNKGYDYIYNDKMGTQTAVNFVRRGWTLNPRLWNIHYQRTHTFGLPGIAGLTEEAGNREDTGLIKVPGRGRSHKVWQTNEYSDVGADASAPKQDLEFKNQQTEKVYFLVVLGQQPNYSGATAKPGLLSFQVRDQYVCTEGQIGQKPSEGYKTPQRPGTKRRRR